MRNTINATATMYVNADRQDRTNVAAGIEAKRYHHPLRMRLYARRAPQAPAPALLAGSKPGSQPLGTGSSQRGQSSCQLGQRCSMSGQQRCRHGRVMLSAMLLPASNWRPNVSAVLRFIT